MHVLLYTWSTCSFCARAKELLDRHGIAYVERAMDGDRAQAKRLEQLFGSPTMPYVLVDGEPLGGLAELERWLADREP